MTKRKQGPASDACHVWHPYTRFSAFADGPLPCITRGEGLYLYDQHGARYLDAISSWWCCHLGHTHPRIVAAIKRQAECLQHSILGNLSHPAARELAQRLAALMPDSRRHVHFASDGASAVEAALKITLQYWHNQGHPERTRFVSLNRGYHGDTLATLSLGFLDEFHQPFAKVRTPVWQLPVPPYDESEDAAYATAEALFEQHGSTLAAMVLEPMCQGAAGMRIYSANYLRELARRCKQHGVLLIADEIAVGFGRTGRMFAYEHAGLDPDVVCVGKGLSAGSLPISAAIVRDSIYETFSDSAGDNTFYHGHTFAGNPIAAAAACEALDIYCEDDIPRRAQEAGDHLQKCMQDFGELEAVQEVRHLGLIAAVELKSESRSAPSIPRSQRIQNELLREGVFIRPLGSVVYLMPPLITPTQTLTEVAEKLRNAIVSAG